MTENTGSIALSNLLAATVKSAPRTRRDILKQAAQAAAVLATANLVTSASASDRDKYLPAGEKAKSLVKEALVVDQLLATPWGLGWTADSQFHEYMDRANKAGITAFSITVASTDFTWDDFLFQVTKHLKVMAQKPDRYTLCRTTRDIRECHEFGRIGIMFNAQSAEFIHYDLDNLLLARELGLKVVNLTYNNQSSYGDGAYVKKGRGLTQRGVDIVDYLHANRIIVDGSHGGIQQGIDTSKRTLEKWPGKPMVYSHSSLMGLFEHPRNLTDEQIKLCAETGGVVNLCLFNIYMGVKPGVQPSAADIAKHVDYVTQLVGVDHVGLATDDSYVLEPMEDYANKNPQIVNDPHLMKFTKNKGTYGAELAKTTPALVDELMKLGYSEDDCRKVLGGNMLRVYQSVWGA